MKRRTFIVTAILFLALCLSCGMMYGVEDERIVSTETVNMDSEFIFWKNDHQACQKEAEKVFREYAENKGLKDKIADKRLLYIRPGDKVLLMTYLYKLKNSETHRVVFVYDSYKNQYKGK